MEYFVAWLAGFCGAAVLTFTLALLVRGLWKFIKFIYGRA